MGQDFTTGTAATTTTSYTFTHRPPCFVSKCSSCPYNNCCANADVVFPFTYPTVTWSGTYKSCGVDNAPCNVEGNCNTCGKCNK